MAEPAPADPRRHQQIVVPTPRPPADDSGSGNDALPRAGRGWPAAEERLGAHAAPYMDPDGTLHNLRPIGRLEVSGPDPEPRRNVETSFGGMWFAAKADPETEPQREVAPHGEAAHQGQAPHGQASHGSEAAQQSEAARREQASQETQASHQEQAVHQQQAVHQEQALHQEQASQQRAAHQAQGPTPGQATHQGQPPHQPQPTHQGGAAPADVRVAVERGLEEPTAAEDGDEPAQPRERPALSAADLEAIRWRLDGGTLREVVDDKEALRELGERLDEPLADEVDNVAKAGLLSVRAEVYRLLGELGMAAAASRLALAHAEAARDEQSTVIAQAELAHILRLRGDHKEADRLFAKAAAAGVPDVLRSVVHENAGRSCFDQGRHMEALDHFARAVRLGRPDDSELAARIGVCLEAVYIHVLRDGWGPYPRTGEDILRS